MIEKLNNIFGRKCTAVNVNDDYNELINVPKKPLRFCEAVECSFKIPIRLHQENVICKGAQRSLGFYGDDRTLAKIISEEEGIADKFVRKTLKKIPVARDIRHINLGLQEYMERDADPDLVLMYVPPSFVTKLIHTFSRNGLQIQVLPFPFLSVCGNVFAGTYSGQVTSISFGLNCSRKSGGLESNELIVGIPFKIIKQLINNF